MGPTQQPAPRTIAGVDGNIAAGHGQAEGDIPVGPHVRVSCTHSENDAACRRVLWQQHLEEEEALVSAWCPKLGASHWGWEGSGLARATTAKVAQLCAGQSLPHLCTRAGTQRGPGPHAQHLALLV